MTAKQRRTYRCEKCGSVEPAETPFSRWTREVLLQSEHGLCVTDYDYLFHRFKTHGNRAVQFMLAVEVKTNGADLVESDPQYDTIQGFNQITGGRKSRKRDASGHPQSGGDTFAKHVFSFHHKKWIVINWLGWHFVRMSGLCPASSRTIEFNRKVIDVDTLIAILQCDIHPWTLKPLTARRHKRESLPLFGE